MARGTLRVNFERPPKVKWARRINRSRVCFAFKNNFTRRGMNYSGECVVVSLRLRVDLNALSRLIVDTNKVAKK